MAADSLRILSTTRAAGYDIPGHPEHPRRVLASLEHLKTILPESVFQEPFSAPLEKILAVHSDAVFQKVQKGKFIDPDTPNGQGVYNCSLLSTGAALQAGEEALKGTQTFSLMRPPGHHATPAQSMGFCYFNSMAISAQDLLIQGKAKRVAIFDLDCHHGNGTEAFCLSKPGLFYASLHQFPAYPGTGYRSMDNCLNYPLPPGTTEAVFFSAMEKAMEHIRDFKPDVIGVSMGFDTYEKDPLTDFGLKKRDYYQMGQRLQEMKLPMFTLLEGGYHDDLPLLIEEFLKGWIS